MQSKEPAGRWQRKTQGEWSYFCLLHPHMHLPVGKRGEGGGGWTMKTREQLCEEKWLLAINWPQPSGDEKFCGLGENFAQMNPYHE